MRQRIHIDVLAQEIGVQRSRRGGAVIDPLGKYLQAERKNFHVTIHEQRVQGGVAEVMEAKVGWIVGTSISILRADYGRSRRR